MTRSPYKVLSALTVPCPGCNAQVGKLCVAKRGYEMSHCHPVRRSAADAKRTAEVNPNVVEIPPEIPLRDYQPERVPDLCPDEARDAP
jgi:hypothetical protein